MRIKMDIIDVMIGEIRKKIDIKEVQASFFIHTNIIEKSCIYLMIYTSYSAF